MSRTPPDSLPEAVGSNPRFDTNGSKRMLSWAGVSVSGPQIHAPKRPILPHAASHGFHTELLRASPNHWQSQHFAVQQLEATGADGQRIPYFLVAPANLSYTRSAPVLLYGDGGESLVPWCSATYGKLLLERGGCLAVANIRGGGEFGPEWHQVEPLPPRTYAVRCPHTSGEISIGRVAVAEVGHHCSTGAGSKPQDAESPPRGRRAKPEV